MREPGICVPFHAGMSSESEKELIMEMWALVSLCHARYGANQDLLAGDGFPSTNSEVVPEWLSPERQGAETCESITHAQERFARSV